MLFSCCFCFFIVTFKDFIKFLITLLLCKQADYRRGYEDIIGKLRALGAKIDCVEENDEPPIRQIG